MAGFEKNGIYDWRIEINQDEMYAEFKGTATEAYDIFRDISAKVPGSKLYCNEKLVAESHIRSIVLG